MANSFSPNYLNNIFQQSVVQGPTGPTSAIDLVDLRNIQSSGTGTINNLSVRTFTGGTGTINNLSVGTFTGGTGTFNNLSVGTLTGGTGTFNTLTVTNLSGTLGSNLSNHGNNVVTINPGVSYNIYSATGLPAIYSVVFTAQKTDGTYSGGINQYWDGINLLGGYDYGTNTDIRIKTAGPIASFLNQSPTGLNMIFNVFKIMSK